MPSLCSMVPIRAANARHELEHLPPIRVASIGSNDELNELMSRSAKRADEITECVEMMIQSDD